MFWSGMFEVCCRVSLADQLLQDPVDRVDNDLSMSVPRQQHDPAAFDTQINAYPRRRTHQ